MISQLTIFGEELELTDQLSFQGGSLASLTALRESVKRLVTSVTYGRKCGELLARLSPNGLWLKTYQGCYQAKMDGSFEEFSETLPRWGLMLDGQLIQPHGLEPSIDESGWRLLPTIVASEYRGAGKNRYIGSKAFRGAKMAEGLRTGCDDPIYTNPNYAEIAMGYPECWSEITPSETP